MKPTRYFVEYTDAEAYKGELDWHRARDPESPESHVDPARYRCSHDCADLEAARTFTKTHSECIIYERCNIEDVTPSEDPPGLLWDYEAEFVEDSCWHA